MPSEREAWSLFWLGPFSRVDPSTQLSLAEAWKYSSDTPSDKLRDELSPPESQWVEADETSGHAKMPFQPPRILEYIKDLFIGCWELAMYMLLIVAAILVLSNEQNFRGALDSSAWWVNIYKTVVICYPGAIMLVQLMLVCEHCFRKFLFFRLLSVGILTIFDTRAIWRSWLMWLFATCFILLEIWSLYSVYQFWGRAETQGPEALSLVVWGVVTIVSIQLLVFINNAAVREKKLLTPMQARVLPPLYVLREKELRAELWRGLTSSLLSFFTCGGRNQHDLPLINLNRLKELAVIKPSDEAQAMDADAIDVQLAKDTTPYESFKTPAGSLRQSSSLSQANAVSPPANQGMERGDEEAGGTAAKTTAGSSGNKRFWQFFSRCCWCLVCCPCTCFRYCCCCGVRQHSFALGFFFFLWPASFSPRYWFIRGDQKYLITILCTFLLCLSLVGALLGFGVYVAIDKSSYVCKIGNNACQDCYIMSTEYIDYYGYCPYIGYNISYYHTDNMCSLLNETQRNCTVDCSFFTNTVFQGNFSSLLPVGQVHLPSAYLLANLAARAYASAFYNIPANANRQFELRFSDYVLPMGLVASDFLFFENAYKYQTQSIITSSNADAVVLFRGTETVSDILFTDIATACRNQDLIPNIGCVHDGFFQAFKVSYQETELALLHILSLSNLTAGSKILVDRDQGSSKNLSSSGPPQRRVWVAGHSLGGAIAILFATYLKSRGYNVAGVVTIGQPRVGKQQFADAYASIYGLQNKTYRFVHEDDPIPMVPPESFGYRHAGSRFVVLDSGSVTYRSDEGCVNTFLGSCKINLSDHYTTGYLSAMFAQIASSNVTEPCAVKLLPRSNDGF